MLELLRIEWIKIRSLNSFKLLLGGFLLGVAGIYFLLATFIPGNLEMVLGSLYSYPEAWFFVHYVAYFFSFFPAIFMIIIVSNEFQFGTCRQNIIDGWSRKEFVFAKFWVALALVLILFAMIVLITLLGSLMFVGELNIAGFLDRIDLPLVTAVQLLLLLMVGMFLGIVVRKTGLAVLIFFLAFPGEAMIRGLLNRLSLGDLNTFFPLRAHTNLLALDWMDLVDGEFDKATSIEALVVAGAWIVIIGAVCLALVQRRDLR